MDELKNVIIQALIAEYGEYALEISDDTIFVNDEDIDLGLCVKIEATT